MELVKFVRFMSLLKKLHLFDQYFFGLWNWQDFILVGLPAMKVNGNFKKQTLAIEILLLVRDGLICSAGMCDLGFFYLLAMV